MIGDWLYRSGVVGDAMMAAGYDLPEGMPTTDNPMQWGSKGKKNDAAQILGWGRNTLSKKMKEHGI